MIETQTDSVTNIVGGKMRDSQRREMKDLGRPTDKRHIEKKKKNTVNNVCRQSPLSLTFILLLCALLSGSPAYREGAL